MPKGDHDIRNKRLRDGERGKAQVYTGNRKHVEEEPKRKPANQAETSSFSFDDRRYNYGKERTEEEAIEARKRADETKRVEKQNQKMKTKKELEADGARDAAFIADTHSWHSGFGDLDDSIWKDKIPKNTTKAHFEHMRACLARL